jgi:hypothetical protein
MPCKYLRCPASIFDAQQISSMPSFSRRVVDMIKSPKLAWQYFWTGLVPSQRLIPYRSRTFPMRMRKREEPFYLSDPPIVVNVKASEVRKASDPFPSLRKRLRAPSEIHISVSERCSAYLAARRQSPDKLEHSRVMKRERKEKFYHSDPPITERVEVSEVIGRKATLSIIL